MGNWASYIVRRTADGAVPGAESSYEGGPGWSSWTLAFRDPDELAEPAGAGPAVLVSEADGGMAVVIGRHAGRDVWRWIYNERAFYGDGLHGPGPAPGQSELDATREARAAVTADGVAEWVAAAGLPAPDRKAVVAALTASDIFAMTCVVTLFERMGIWS
jgi:hypothetical protein